MLSDEQVKVLKEHDFVVFSRGGDNDGTRIGEALATVLLAQQDAEGRLEEVLQFVEQGCGQEVDSGALDPNTGEGVNIWKPCQLGVGLVALLRGTPRHG